MSESLAAFGVEASTTGSYESALHEGDPEPGRAHAGGARGGRGTPTRSDGALWLRTTDFGDDKDRVLVRSNGEHTYFASDIAYHQDKRERGFERQIDVWGADHHGYVLRMKAAYEALGGDPDELELLIMQLVHLVRSGERAQMSKRAGEFVDAGRPGRGDRRRRGALVPAGALARHDRRPRPRSGARAVEREPRLLRAVRARADRLDAGEGGRRARARRRSARRRASVGPRAAASVRARADRAAAGVPRRARGGGRAARAAPASRRTRWSWRRPSRPSTATAACVGARAARRSSRCGSRCAWRAGARSRRCLELLGVSAPEEM